VIFAPSFTPAAARLKPEIHTISHQFSVMFICSQGKVLFVLHHNNISINPKSITHLISLTGTHCRLSISCLLPTFLDEVVDTVFCFMCELIRHIILFHTFSSGVHACALLADSCPHSCWSYGCGQWLSPKPAPAPFLPAGGSRLNFATER
jgi:hypothetical protein